MQHLRRPDFGKQDRNDPFIASSDMDTSQDMVFAVEPGCKNRGKGSNHHQPWLIINQPSSTTINYHEPSSVINPEQHCLTLVVDSFTRPRTSLNSQIIWHNTTRQNPGTCLVGIGSWPYQEGSFNNKTSGVSTPPAPGISRFNEVSFWGDAI